MYHFGGGEIGAESIFPRMVPHYLAGINVVSHGGDGGSDMEHPLDASKILALAYYFSRIQGTPDETYLVPFSELYRTQEMFTFNEWIRPGAPPAGLASYRLAPPRKFSWWFRTTTNMDWLIGTDTKMKYRQDEDSAIILATVDPGISVAKPGDFD